VIYSFYGLSIELPEYLDNKFKQLLKADFPLFFNAKNNSDLVKTNRSLVFAIQSTIDQSPFCV